MNGSYTAKKHTATPNPHKKYTDEGSPGTAHPDAHMMKQSRQIKKCRPMAGIRKPQSTQKPFSGLRAHL